MSEYIGKTCAFTGHRPSKLPWGGDEGDARCLAFLKTVRGHLERLIDGGVTRFLSGMAPGVDMMAAEMVLEIKRSRPELPLRLQCVVPYMGQERGLPDAQKARYQAILQECGDIVVISPTYTKDCIMDRNRYLADHAGILLAAVSVWRSGSGATVSFARKNKREIILINLNEYR